MTKDYLDTKKYKQSGAYHWKNYILNENYRKYVDWIVNFIFKHEIPEKPILDMGCGDGLFTFLLRKRGLRIYGYDIDPVALKIANKIDCNTSHTDFIQKINYKTLLLFDVFEHIENLIKFKKNVLSKISKTIYLVNPQFNSTFHFYNYKDQEIISQFNFWKFKLNYIKKFQCIDKTLLVFKRI